MLSLSFPKLLSKLQSFCPVLPLVEETKDLIVQMTWHGHLADLWSTLTGYHISEAVIYMCICLIVF